MEEKCQRILGVNKVAQFIYVNEKDDNVFGKLTKFHTMLDNLSYEKFIARLSLKNVVTILMIAPYICKAPTNFFCYKI